MTTKRTFWSLLLAAAILAGSCAQDEIGQAAETGPGDEISSKLVFTAENATPGELLVCFGDEAVARIEASVGAVTRAGGIATRSGIGDFDAVLDGIGVKSLRRLFPIDKRNEERTRAAGLHRWYLVEFDVDADLDRAARNMAAIAEVSNVEFNQRLKHASCGKVVPLTEDEAAPRTRTAVNFDDPYLDRQWHYINTGDPTIYAEARAGADVNCAEAWRLCTGDPRVVVAVIDDCVQWDHPDLAANMWINSDEKENGADSDGNGYADDIHGYNFVDDTRLTISTGEDADHGTHVAGTVAAVNNNGTGVCGIAGGSGNNDGVKIMSCQIFCDDRAASAAQTALAFKYAADNGAAIAQCSFGYDAGAIRSDEAYARNASAEKQAIDYFIATQNCPAVGGGVVIFAAGNDAAAMSGYPGAYRDYVSVTSFACDFTPAYYTNYGPGCNIAAPGGDAYQSYPKATSQILSTITDGGYGYMQGTSMACPHVSGVAALGISYALQLGKTFSQSEFVALLLTSVNDLNPYCTGSDAKYAKQMGSGYIDAYRLLMNVRGITCIPVPVGTQASIRPLDYLGDGNPYLTIAGAEIAAEDKARLGIASDPTIFSNQVLFKCSKPGSAIIRIRLQAGTNSGSGMNGMTITREFALIARENRSSNGGWL
ncbi:MAG: S8 family serine peptidase [Alistipes sp.]|nr:S8 family serine peptidase [Alistipes sp.]